MSDFTIYSDDVGKVRRLMVAYQASVKAEYIVLCHRDGSIIAEVGSLGIDPTPLAVLSTASFDSARQVGNMLGGENFQSVSYSGENRSIYISPVDQALLLVQVFPGSRLPNRIDDFNRLLVEKLVDAVPSRCCLRSWCTARWPTFQQTIPSRMRGTRNFPWPRVQCAGISSRRRLSVRILFSRKVPGFTFTPPFLRPSRTGKTPSGMCGITVWIRCRCCPAI